MGSGPQTDKHLPQRPFAGKFTNRWRHFALPSMSLIFLRSSPMMHKECGLFFKQIQQPWQKCNFIHFSYNSGEFLFRAPILQWNIPGSWPVSLSHVILRYKHKTVHVVFPNLHSKSLQGNCQKCVTELETTCINRMCIAMEGGGVYSVHCIQTSQLTLKSRLLRHITLSYNNL